MSKDPTAKYVIGGWWLILAIAVIGFSTGIFYVKEDPVEEEPTIEDRCKFVVKTNGDSYLIETPKIGTYRYELLSHEDGYVEVWKCNGI